MDLRRLIADLNGSATRLHFYPCKSVNIRANLRKVKIKDIQYKTGKTDNDLEYILYQNKKSYSISIQLLVKTGSTYDSIPGVSHFLEHMVFRSSTNKTYKQKQKALEYRGSYKDGLTSYEYNEYSVNLPYTQLEWGFNYIKDLLIDAAFVEKELELERKVIIDEISKGENDPYELSYQITKQNYLKKDSPFFHEIAGDKSSMLTANKQHLVDFYKNYNNKNIVIGVSGRFKENKVIDLINNLSNELEKSKNENVFEFKGIQQKNPEKIIIQESPLSKNAVISLTKIDKGFKQTSKQDLTAINLLNTIAVSGGSSQLYQALREESGYLYSYYLFNYTYNSFGFDGLFFECESEYVYDILKTIRKTLNKVLDKGIKNKDVQHWKNYLKNRLLIKNDSHVSILQGLIKSEFHYNKIYTPADSFKIIDNITTEDINKQINRLDVSKYNAVMFGKVDSIDKSNIEKILFD